MSVANPILRIPHAHSKDPYHHLTDSDCTSSGSTGSSSSSNHSDEEECTQVKTQPCQSGYKRDNDFKPTPVNLIQMCDEDIYLADDDGLEVETDSEFFKRKMMEPLQLYIDPAVFGTLTEHLQPKEGKSDLITDEAKKLALLAMVRPYFSEINFLFYNCCGLPINDGEFDEENASLHSNSESIVFGWNEFPIRFLQKTLENWKKGDYPMLNTILITRKSQATDRKKLISDNLSCLIPVWTLSQHKESVFNEQNIDEYKEVCKGQDLVEMYVLFSNVDDRMAVVSVSDYAIYIHIGHTDFEDSEFPAMKTAFSEVTTSDVFYQINGPKLRELTKKK